jgi:hypothetical protein
MVIAVSERIDKTCYDDVALGDDYSIHFFRTSPNGHLNRASKCQTLSSKFPEIGRYN